MQEKKLFLLDAMALIYRAYFALNKMPRINSKGLNTSAILGFANTLLELLRKEEPTHIGVAFDTQAPTNRKLEFVDYKANRERMPEDISLAIPYIKQLLEHLNIPILSVDGYEADDVIGTLAKKAEKAGYKVYMVTPDKDFGQLVSDNIFMYKPARMGNGVEILGPKEVCEKFGIANQLQMIDMLGMWGDSSDNIPGIPGVGEVTARKLLAQFGSLENILENTDKIDSAKLREKVENNKQTALDSKMLATIVLDVPIDFKQDELILSKPKFEEVEILLQDLEMSSFSNRIFKYYKVDKNFGSEVSQSLETSATKVQQTGKQQVSLGVTMAGSSSGAEKASQQQLDLFSMETAVVGAKELPIHNWQTIDEFEKGLADLISKHDKLCFYIRSNNSDLNFMYQYAKEIFISEGENLYSYRFENKEFTKRETDLIQGFLKSDIRLITYGYKQQYHLLHKLFSCDKLNVFDILLAHYLINPEINHGLENLCANYLNIRNLGSPQNYLPYILQLSDILLAELENIDARKLYYDIELPLVEVLVDMESRGVKIDTEMLNAYSIELAKQIKTVETRIHELAGVNFNIASPKQLGEVLYEKLKITDKPKQTKTKQFSTAEDVLQKLIKKHPIVSEVLQYRSLSKLKSTYVDALPLLVNKQTGHIHTTYKQTLTVTGRLSSQNPNLQNIPIRTSLGKEIRRAFIANNASCVLLSADYSQIELRIIAQLSGDKSMLSAFLSFKDIHTATAANIFNIDIDEVTPEQRRSAKAVNFGIIYGMSAFGLSERLEIGRKEASELIERYFEKYSGLKQYIDAVIEEAREKGYVKTLSNRRRYLRDINSSNSLIRAYAERNAVNAPIQGSSADMIKIAMGLIYKEIRDKNLKSNMILQIHDELIFNAYKEELEILIEIVSRNMKLALNMQIPIEIGINYAYNWLDAH